MLARMRGVAHAAGIGAALRSAQTHLNVALAASTSIIGYFSCNSPISLAGSGQMAFYVPKEQKKKHRKPNLAINYVLN